MKKIRIILSPHCIHLWFHMSNNHIFHRHPAHPLVTPLHQITAHPSASDTKVVLRSISFGTWVDQVVDAFHNCSAHPPMSDDDDVLIEDVLVWSVWRAGPGQRRFSQILYVSKMQLKLRLWRKRYFWFVDDVLFEGFIDGVGRHLMMVHRILEICVNNVGL